MFPLPLSFGLSVPGIPGRVLRLRCHSHRAGFEGMKKVCMNSNRFSKVEVLDSMNGRMHPSSMCILLPKDLATPITVFPVCPGRCTLPSINKARHNSELGHPICFTSVLHPSHLGDWCYNTKSPGTVPVCWMPWKFFLFQNQTENICKFYSQTQSVRSGWLFVQVWLTTHVRSISAGREISGWRGQMLVEATRRSWKKTPSWISIPYASSVISPGTGIQMAWGLKFPWWRAGKNSEAFSPNADL